MPLDPDDIRTPPALEPELADEVAGRAAVELPRREPGSEPRLIDRVDDQLAAASRPASRPIPDGPAPHPFVSPLGPPIDSGALEPDAATRSAWMQAVSDHVLELLRTIPLRPAAGRIGAAGQKLAEQHRAAIGEKPIDGGIAHALELIAGSMDAALETAGPGYLAYVPGGGLYAAGLADLIADVGNRFTGYAMAAPGWVALEQDVIDWLLREFGYQDPAARGLMTTGSSMANFTALVTARHHHFGDRGDYSRAIVYTSTQAHHSIAKAVRMVGVPVANLRAVAVDELFRLDVEDLRRQIEADRHRGLRPFCVIAAAGTTNTGAVDPLVEIAALCRREDLWLHVDGAYGGSFVLTPSGRSRLRGIADADSICFDPHKGMFLPYGTGCLLVRDGARLAAAHMGEADYLRDFSDSATPSPAHLGPELSRPFRGLRLWLPLMLHGARAFRDALDEKLALAQLCAEGLDRRIAAGKPIEMVARPQLSTVAFRLQRASGEPLADYNVRNVALLERINGRNRAYLSSTLLPVIDGLAVTLRVCVMSFRTHRERIDALLEDLDLALARQA